MRDFVRTNQTPYKVSGKITKEVWEEFVKARTTEEALKKSKESSEIAKKNVHRHKLGSGGYVGKQDKWSKEAEEFAKAGKPDPFGKFDPTQQWLKTRREGSSIEREMTSPSPRP